MKQNRFRLSIISSLTKGNKKDRASYCKAKFDRSSVHRTNLPTNEGVNGVSIAHKNAGKKGGRRIWENDQDIEHSGMYEGTPEDIEKVNDEWGEYRLLRAK